MTSQITNVLTGFHSLDPNGYEAAQNMALRELLMHSRAVRSEKGCWIWLKTKNRKGYGVISWGRFRFAVHRLSFAFHKGLIPQGFVVMHECDTPSCFNPQHLFLGTQHENMRDMKRKGRARHARTRPNTLQPE